MKIKNKINDRDKRREFPTNFYMMEVYHDDLQRRLTAAAVAAYINEYKSS